MSLFPNENLQSNGNYFKPGYIIEHEYGSYHFISGDKDITLYQIFDYNNFYSPVTVTHTTDENEEITGWLYAGKINDWNCHGWEPSVPYDSYLHNYNSYPLHLFVVNDPNPSGSKQSEAESRAYTPFTKEINVTYTAEAKLCNGWNLVGNPFHAYLDFDKFAKTTAEYTSPNNEKISDNTYIVYNADGFGSREDGDYGDGFSYYVASGSNNGAYASRYLHSHQGFFVKMGSNETLTFSEDMTVLRKDIGTSGSYRDDSRPAYPLVNLFLTSDKGCSDVCVVEFNRPEWGGATKLRDMYSGNGLFYAAHDDGNYAALFATPEAERIPLKFEAKDETGDTYTLSWNTANGDFNKLYLVDNMTGVKFDMLRNSSYSFQGKKSDYWSRFHITFGVTDINEHDEDDDGNTTGSTFAFYDGTQWVIAGGGTLEMIDLQGRILYSTTLGRNGQARINLPKVATGMYLLKMTNDLETKVQKVIVG